MEGPAASKRGFGRGAGLPCPPPLPLWPRPDPGYSESLEPGAPPRGWDSRPTRPPTSQRPDAVQGGQSPLPCDGQQRGERRLQRARPRRAGRGGNGAEGAGRSGRRWAGAPGGPCPEPPARGGGPGGRATCSGTAARLRVSGWTCGPSPLPRAPRSPGVWGGGVVPGTGWARPGAAQPSGAGVNARGGAQALARDWGLRRAGPFPARPSAQVPVCSPAAPVPALVTSSPSLRPPARERVRRRPRPPVLKQGRPWLRNRPEIPARRHGHQSLLGADACASGGDSGQESCCVVRRSGRALGSENLYSPVPCNALATWGRGLCSTVRNRGLSVT